MRSCLLVAPPAPISTQQKDEWAVIAARLRDHKTIVFDTRHTSLQQVFRIGLAVQ